VFVGCISIALAEILDTFPIFTRRLKLKENSGLKLLISMAIGKTIGALLYFYFGYGLMG
jgi:stage V sporulation protein AB